MTITKNELVDEVIKSADLKRFVANKFIDDFFEIIAKSLEGGEWTQSKN
jgi:nucleoid DNA-binding protein